MDNTSRLRLIANLEETCQSRVIAYLTRDHQHFGAKIALDVLPLFYQLLQCMGHQDKLSLFLHSGGGSLDAPWPLVNLLREYCDDLEILVPSRALSAATLISLGANRIVMTPLSQLSPVDPEGTFTTPEGKQESYAVEDVVSYVEFAREKMGIAESQPLSEVLRFLTDEIKPHILGSLNRTHSRIRQLARSMLQLHLTEPKHGTQISEIVDNLTQLLFAHNHLVNRREARDTLGFGQLVQYAEEIDGELAQQMQQLYCLYADDLQLDKTFDPLELLGGQTQAELGMRQAYIESRELTHLFTTQLLIHFNKETQQINMQQKGMPRWSTYVHSKESEDERA